MKASMRNPTAKLFIVAAFVVLMPFATSDIRAEQKPGSTAEQLIGLWTLVSVKNLDDDKTTEPFGANPKGLFIFDRSGRYAILQFRPGIPKFASNCRAKGTPEGNKAVVLGSNAHFGTYSVRFQSVIATFYSHATSRGWAQFPGCLLRVRSVNHR